MSYRDDLQAAHYKIAALEQELAKIKTLPTAYVQPQSSSNTHSNVADAFEAMAKFSPEIRGALDFRRKNGLPLVSRAPTATARGYAPITFSAEGKVGEIITVQKRGERLFRGDELFAMDTSSRPGHGTSIEALFHGAEAVLIGTSIPTWMFYEWLPPEERAAYEAEVKLLGTASETAETRSIAQRLRIANAAMKMTWKTFQPGLDITWQVKFLETCRWEAVLWGDTLR